MYRHAYNQRSCWRCSYIVEQVVKVWMYRHAYNQRSCWRCSYIVEQVAKEHMYVQACIQPTVLLKMFLYSRAGGQGMDVQACIQPTVLLKMMILFYRMTLPLPEQVPLQFAALPEFLVESIADYVLFCSRLGHTICVVHHYLWSSWSLLSHPSPPILSSPPTLTPTLSSHLPLTLSSHHHSHPLLPPSLQPSPPTITPTLSSTLSFTFPSHPLLPPSMFYSPPTLSPLPLLPPSPPTLSSHPLFVTFFLFSLPSPSVPPHPPSWLPYIFSLNCFHHPLSVTLSPSPAPLTISPPLPSPSLPRSPHHLSPTISLSFISPSLFYPF